MGFDFGISEIAAVASLAGTGISAIGAISQGNASAAEARYAAQVAENNAIIANQNANYTIASGEARAFDQSLKERASYGALLAGLSAGGLDVNTGSAADLRVGKREVGLTNVTRTRENAALDAYGYRTQSTNFRAQSQLSRAAADYDTTAGWLKGAGGLLAGAGSIGSNWLKLQDNSVWGDWSPR